MIRFFHLLWLATLAQCYPSPAVFGQFTEQEFNQMADRMADGSVADISVQELRQQVGEVVLLDTREYQEYMVSHLPEALWVGYDDFDLRRVAHLPKDTKIITYCSVGYRSERVGEKLQKAGFTEVYNLKGSIFKWVNEGYPIVDSTRQTTQRIHGYDNKWGKWLKAGEVVYD